MQPAHDCGNSRLSTGVLISCQAVWRLRPVPIPYFREPVACSCRRKAISRSQYRAPCLAVLCKGKAVAAPTVEEEDEAISVVAGDIEQQSRDFVLKQLHQKLKGHGLAEFVGHLLNLMGYKTKVSPPGPDRGIDIWANKDDLGVTPPTIIVQVKSGEGDVNEATVSELSGKVSEKDFGLFVSAGGFNKRARDFASAKRNLKLIDGDELVDLVYKYYSQLDAKYKGLIPLRQVYIPETLTE